MLLLSFVWGEDKPCFDRRDDLSLGSVFLDIDGPVCLLLPDGGLVGLVHDQELDVDVGAQLRVAPVRGTDTDPVTGSLYIHIKQQGQVTDNSSQK